MGRFVRAGRGVVVLLAVAAAPCRAEVLVGAAKVDVTPDFPIRLCGYAARDAEATSAVQHLFARALAIGEGETLAVLVSVDNTAIAQRMSDEVAARLATKAGLARDRFTLCVTHTHCAPVLDGGIDCMFGRPIPADQWERIGRYSAWLLDRIEEAALQAIAARAPARLAWSEGSVDFARNRRTAGGPVDRALPLLAAFREDGALVATVENYACHCTTCNHQVNQHCGDWAGYASEAIEVAHAGAVALTVIGCGADANPEGGPTADLRVAQRHGKRVAEEVEKLLAAPMRPLLQEGGAPSITVERFELPYAPLPTRAEWEARVKAGGAVGFHAQQWLARLDRGEALPAALPYRVQAWQWGDELVQLFLPGEVVVDYALRLKRELDRGRLWITAYSNDVPCYVPSERVLREGGYEAGGAMTYYGRPGPLAKGVEQTIVDAVHRLVPATFAAPADDPRFPAPKSAAESQRCFELSREELAIELVACEPQVQSPVAIDFAADGTLYVCEMNDYPSGLDGNYAPGGRVTWLRDRDGDGRYEENGVLVDALPFPTGVMAWKRGALVCAAPDILYVEDTNGDGRADVRRVLFTGFSTENYQARVNSLTWGLDGWIYGSCGLFGGVITGFVADATTPGATPRALPPVDCRGRDFRLDPDRGVIEAIEGTSQQGRVRDDFGRWYGCNSSWLLFQFPIADRYLRRNPYVAPPDPRWNVLADADPRRLFQISPVLERFNESGDASRVTSACGLGLYRDDWLGAEFFGNAFTCEPVANVVRRTVLDTSGSAVVGRRAPEEEAREFLASRDPWFRPVQATTGPDGALWIVDMYRFVIEHPRWIPAARLAELDVRAGFDKGRIWRVVRKGAEKRRVPDLIGADVEELRHRLIGENGVVRDLAHRELLERGGPPAMADKQELQSWHALPFVLGRDASGGAACVQEAWCFEQLARLTDADVKWLLVYEDDVPPDVRVACMPLAEKHLSKLVDDPDAEPLSSEEMRPHVNEMTVWQRSMSDAEALRTALQPIGYPDASPIAEAGTPAERLATLLALGASPRRLAGKLLGKALIADADDPWLRAAILTAAPRHAAALIAALLAVPSRTPAQQEAFDAIVATAGALPADQHHEKLHVLAAIVGQGEEAARETWRWRATARLLQGMETNDEFEDEEWFLDPCAKGDARRLEHGGHAMNEQLGEILAAAVEVLTGETEDGEPLAAEAVSPAAVAAALELFFREGGRAPLATSCLDLVAGLGRFLEPTQPPECGLAVIAAFARRSDVVELSSVVLSALPRMTPRLRAAALDYLFARPELLDATLLAVEEARLPASCFDAAHRDRMLRHDDETVRARATKLLAPSGTKKRAQVVAQFQPALALKGEVAHGKELFAKLCASCHSFRGAGFDVGPDLAALGDRSAPRLLEALLDPNAAVNGDFVGYRVQLHDGSDLTGLIRGESSGGFTLVQANDLRRTLLRREVKEVAASKVSLMPEGLEEGLAPQDVSDLISWLQSGPLALASVTPAQVAAARAELAARPLNGFAQLLERFDDFAQPSWLGVVPMRYCRQQDGKGVVRWRSGPAESLASDASRVELRFAAAVGFVSQPAAGFALALDGRELLDFDVVTSDARWHSADGSVDLAFECRAANPQDATGLMTLTLPASLLPAGRSAELRVVGRAASSQRWFGLLDPGRD